MSLMTKKCELDRKIIGRHVQNISFLSLMESREIQVGRILLIKHLWNSVQYPEAYSVHF